MSNERDSEQHSTQPTSEWKSDEQRPETSQSSETQQGESWSEQPTGQLSDQQLGTGTITEARQDSETSFGSDEGRSEAETGQFMGSSESDSGDYLRREESAEHSGSDIEGSSERSELDGQ